MAASPDVQVRETSDAKGLGLFAVRGFLAGEVVLEEKAIFKTQNQTWYTLTGLHLATFNKVLQGYGGLLEGSTASARSDYERWLYREPAPHMLAEMAPTRALLETHDDAFRQLDETTKRRNLYGFLNFYDGALDMHDARNDYDGFSVHGGFLNHACVPNALYCISDGHDDMLKKHNWITGSVQIRALRDIQPGEEITVAYHRILRAGRDERRQYLLDAFKFHCQCHSCCRTDSLLEEQLFTLSVAIRTMFTPGESHSRIFRSAWIADAMASDVGCNDIIMLRVWECCVDVAIHAVDRFREKYFVNKCMFWNLTYLPQNHYRTVYSLGLYQHLLSLGVPSPPLSEEARRLMFMLNHPDNHDNYHYLRHDGDVLSEYAADQNRLLICYASAKLHGASETGWDESTLADVVNMFDEPFLKFKAEAAHASLLRELEEEAALQSSALSKKRKKKNKSQKKQAGRKEEKSGPQEAESSKAVSERPLVSETGSPLYPSKSVISDAASFHRNSPRPKAREIQSPGDWETVESKKRTKTKKAEKRAADTNPSSSAWKQAERSRPNATTPVISRLDTSSEVTPSQPFTPQSPSGVASTFQWHIPAPSPPAQDAVASGVPTPPPSEEQNNTTCPILPRSPNITIVSPNTPPATTTPTSLPPESQTVQLESPMLSSCIPRVKIPATGGSLVVIDRPQIPSYRFLGFRNDLTPRKWSTGPQQSDYFDTPIWYATQAVFTAVLGDAGEARPIQDLAQSTRNGCIRGNLDDSRESAWKQFRRKKMSDPCDEVPVFLPVNHCDYEEVASTEGTVHLPPIDQEAQDIGGTDSPVSQPSIVHEHKETINTETAVPQPVGDHEEEVAGPTICAPPRAISCEDEQVTSIETPMPPSTNADQSGENAVTIQLQNSKLDLLIEVLGQLVADKTRTKQMITIPPHKYDLRA